MTQPMDGQVSIFDLDTAFGRMCPECYPATTERTSESSSKRSAKCGTNLFMCLHLSNAGGGIDKWSKSGAIVADGYSVAWRIMDAQYFGVPQRRRRIALVADFGGQSAPEILFDGESLRWDSEQSRKAWESIARHATGSIDGNGCTGIGTFQNTGRGWWNKSDVGATFRTPRGGDSLVGNLIAQVIKVRCGCAGGGKGALISKDKSFTLSAQNPSEQTIVYPDVSRSLCARADASPCVDRGQPFVVYGVDENGNGETRLSKEVHPTLSAGGGKIGQGYAATVYAIDSLSSNSMKSRNPNSGFHAEEVSKTLQTGGVDPTCNQGGNVVVQSVISFTNRGYECGSVTGTLRAEAHGGNPMVAAFMGGQGEKSGGLGYQEEMSPTLKSTPSGGNTVPDVVYCLQGNGIDRADTAVCNGRGWKEDASYTLNTIDRPAVVYPKTTGTLCASGAGLTRPAGQGNETDMCVVTAQDCRSAYGNEELSATLQAKPSGGQSLNCVNPIVYAKQRFDDYTDSGVCSTMQARQFRSPADICVVQSKPPRKYIIRRLTPLECSRLQGLPDCDGGWCNIPSQEHVTIEDIAFWRSVWDEWCEINNSKRKTDKQIAKWLKSLVSESAQSQMYGNGIALPQWVYVMGRISEMYKDEKPTMASLFDGTGSFPLIFESINGKGTVLWSSEVNPEAVRVSKYRLG